MNRPVAKKVRPYVFPQSETAKPKTSENHHPERSCTEVRSKDYMIFTTYSL